MKPDETRDLPMPCGRSIHGDARYFPQGSYHGRRVYFCTDFCRSAFEAEPERFLKAHRRLPVAEREKRSYQPNSQRNNENH